MSDWLSSGRGVVLGVGLLLVLAVLAFIAGGPGPQGPEQNPLAADDLAPRIGERPAPTDTAPLPDFELPAFDGDGVVRSSDYRGKPLVLNFWASWCAPCVEEMPALQQVARETDGRIAFLGVDTEDFERDRAATLVAETGVTYDLAVDRDGSLFRKTKQFGMPTTLFVDAQGMIVYRHTGGLTADQLRDLIETYL